MDWARGRYIGEVGIERFNDWVIGDDLGLRYFLGFEKGLGSEIVEITKQYLGMIWNKRREMLAQQNASHP